MQCSHLLDYHVIEMMFICHYKLRNSSDFLSQCLTPSPFGLNLDHDCAITFIKMLRLRSLCRTTPTQTPQHAHEHTVTGNVSVLL